MTLIERNNCIELQDRFIVIVHHVVFGTFFEMVLYVGHQLLLECRKPFERQLGDLT